MHSFRRLVTRWEYHIENFLGFVQLGCLHAGSVWPCLMVAAECQFGQSCSLRLKLKFKPVVVHLKKSGRSVCVDILAINCGSSSLKYQLFDWEKKEIIAKGLVERVTIGGSFIVSKSAGGAVTVTPGVSCRVTVM